LREDYDYDVLILFMFVEEFGTAFKLMKLAAWHQGPERRRLLCEEFEEQWTQATDQK
jgi:hypothetical protein